MNFHYYPFPRHHFLFLAHEGFSVTVNLIAVLYTYRRSDEVTT
jgi:hypothetical protein